MAIGFNNVASFNGAGSANLSNPTSLQFGPDGRLYVSEQNGTINVFTVESTADDDGVVIDYNVTGGEELKLASGGGVVKSILNHNDDGSPNTGQTNRQVTGIVVTGTATNPVLYITSSDPQIATFNDSNLDTNSGVLTKVTWTGTEWDAVDLIRGLPRSEENHSVNGMVLTPDGNTLYLNVGGNTNNGAPSDFFTYTGEYALSGTVLEIDLVDLESRQVLTDPNGGQNGASRKYIYDLPTLDDPTVDNVTDGIGEDANGLDEAGPWGGNDGFNMAILPKDAPFRIYADGFRNHYDLVLTASGQLYTVDNGSNGGLGGDPVVGGDGQATNQVNNGGSGDPEPLFLIEDGGYYGHPVPARANQNLPWTVFNDSGNPDGSLSLNSVSDLSALVPDGVDIEPGFLIDPSKFTGNSERLEDSGERVERDDNDGQGKDTNALVTIGSSSNGLVEYKGGAFDGALDGALLVAQFNGNITILNVNATGTGLDPIIDPGPDGILATGDDFTVNGGGDGVDPLFGGLQTPLDVTVNPDDGTIWVAEIGGGIAVYAPTDAANPIDLDLDNDGIDNAVDPFIFDATNGTSAQIRPGQTLLWDFDSNLDENLPGPSGYGGGLTGVMIDRVTDFQAFFQEESTLLNQDINLDNVKFITAAGGGTTVVEFASNGDALGAANSGEFLFHTGVTVGAAVETFTVQWTIFNPAGDFTGPNQEIGGYLGTGDQSNYLKLVATPDDPNNLNDGEIKILLEDNDVVIAESFIQANDLFTVPANQQIFFQLEVNPGVATATPTITYETGTGTTNTVSGTAISLVDTNVLEAILGNTQVQGQDTGLAVGLFSTNRGQPAASASNENGSFAAVFGDIEITATGPEADLELSKVVDNASSDIGDNVTFTLTVNNVGPDGATGVSVSDSLPSGLAHVSDTGSGAYNPTTGIWTVGNIANGGSATLNITAEVIEFVESTILYRVNAGGNAVAAFDGGPAWLADTGGTPSIYLTDPGSNNTAGFAALELGGTVPTTVPDIIFDTERWEAPGGAEMQWGFDVAPGSYEVRLFMGNGFSGTSAPGQRVFDVAIEGTVLENLDDLDLSSQFGHEVGAMISNVVDVTDGTLNLEFIHGVENPLVNGIEIIQVGTANDPNAYINYAEILTLDQLDPDSTAGNSSNGEDDDATIAVTPVGSLPVVNLGVTPTTGSEAATTVITVTAVASVPVVGGQTVDVALTGAGITAADFVEPIPTQLTILDGQTIASFTMTIADDAAVELTETATVSISNPSAGLVLGTTTSGNLTITDDPVSGGAATLSINLNSNNIQASNFGDNSFQITNTGNKNIAQVDIDVTNALYADTVFDPEGVAGDTVSKELDIDTAGGTGVVNPASYNPYVGAGGAAGYEGLTLLFDNADNGGFEPGEAVGFSVDMDPNSVAGTDKGSLDGGAYNGWDVGGVSGAELIGSTFTVTFTDGTTATGQLQGNASQAGSQGLASQDSPNLAASLTVNGLGAGGVGTYSTGGPSVIVDGPGGATVRVVLTKGFIQPDAPYAQFLTAQLADLAAQIFPANNAVEFQTVDVEIPATGGPVDISTEFDFSGVDGFNFTAADNFNGLEENQLPLGFVASVIDSTNNNLQIGPVTTPIYLEFADTVPAPTVSVIGGPYIVGEGAGQVQISLLTDVTVPASETVDVTFEIVPDTATVMEDYDYTSGTATFDAATGVYTDTVSIAGSSSDVTFLIGIEPDALEEGDEAFTVNIIDVSPNAQIGTASADVTITDDDISDGTVVAAINAGGPALTQDGINFAADNYFLNGNTFEDSAADNNGLQPIFDGTVYETERFGGSPSAAPLAYSIPVAPGEYTVELYFTEIYQSAAGARIFDVTVEGQLVLDDFDILAQTEDDFNQSIVFNVPDTFSPGANNAIDISFGASVDNGKVGGIVVRSADGVTPEIPEVNLSVTPAAAVEGTAVTVTATASAAVSGDQTVNVTFAGIDITAADFVTSIPTQIPIANGQTEGSVTFTIADDGVVEAAETATFSISNPSVGLVLGATTADAVVITDISSYTPPLDNLFGTAIEISGDRLSPTSAGILALGNNVITATQEGEIGDNSFRDRDIFTFSVPDGFVLTGIELQDFVNSNPVLSPGFFGLQLGSQLTVDVVTGEPDSGTDGLLGGIIYNSTHVGQNLLDIMAQGGEIQPGSGIVIDPFVPALTGNITVWLNQGAGPGTPTLNFIVEAPNEVSIVTTLDGSEPATNGQFTVSLTEVVTTDTTVTYTVGGSATPDADYTPLSGTVTILANETSATIDVAVLNDLIEEGTENVIVTLDAITASDPNVVLGTATEATVTIADDDAPVPTGVVFQTGVNGYQGTVDTYLQSAAPDANNSSALSLNVDGSDAGGPVQGLIRFDDIFGSQSGQIPLDAQIQSAVLELQVTNPGDNLSLYEMLQSWSDTDTWNSLGSGIQTNGSEAASSVVASTGSVNTGMLTIDVTNSLVNWQTSPTERNGWALLPTGSNGVDFNSSESGNGPRLVVDFTSQVGPTVSIGATQDGNETGPVSGQFTVNLSEAVVNDTVISYNVTGTAAANTDYTALAGTVTIAAGLTSALIPVAVLGDEAAEGAESVVVTLTGASGSDAVLGAAKTATVIIADDDAAAETLIAAVNAGISDETYVINGVAVTFESDNEETGGAAAEFLTSGSEGGGGSKLYSGNPAITQAQNYGPDALSELHWTERSSAEAYFGYEIPNLENGLYRADIYIAEIYHGVNGNSWADNQRVFDILIEGNLVEDNFDPFDLDPSAPATEIKLSYEFGISDGGFTLDLDGRSAAGGIDQPKISGFALYQLDPNPLP